MFGHQSHNDEDNDTPAENHGADQSLGGDMPWQHPGKPLDDDQPAHSTAAADNTISDNDAPAMPAEPAEDPETHVYAPDDNDAKEVDKPGDEPESTDSSSDAGGTNDLIDIKRDALNSLTPLVDHLEQSPEEKFRTTMMMIQASDNQSLIETAYAAAQKISDEKARAQALLDVINEINYFTQPHDHDKDS